MLVFVDESGDTGFKFTLGSSQHFVISAVVFRDRAVAEKCDQAISRLRDSLGWHPRREFHFYKSDDCTRRQFYAAVADFDFRLISFALNKPRLIEGALRQKDRLYMKVMSWVFDNAAPWLDCATVVVDKSGGRDFREELARVLKQWTNTAKHPNAIKKIRHEDSHSNNLLQLADMVVCAISRRYKPGVEDRERYWTMIRRRSVSLREWPQ
jgi:hypothetical protein